MSSDKQPPPPQHFEGKQPLEHVVEVQTNGMMTSHEIHGAETPGPISAGADAARDTGAAYLLLLIILSTLPITYSGILLFYGIFSSGWLVWKTGRSSWLAWMRLERLHRLVAEEKWEIEHHREQERDELAVLYRAKGFEGKLLEDVLDVLMSDKDRTLRVMVEEELGLKLEGEEHPLKQGLGVTVGVVAVFILCLALEALFPFFGILSGSMLGIGGAAWIFAHFEKNRRISAVIWNIGLASASFLTGYFIFTFIM